MLIAIPLLLEIHPRIPQFGWVPWGFALAALILIAAMGSVAAGAPTRKYKQHGDDRRALIVIVGGLLGLTVTPTEHAHVKGTVDDTFPPTLERSAATTP